MELKPGAKRGVWHCEYRYRLPGSSWAEFKAMFFIRCLCLFHDTFTQSCSVVALGPKPASVGVEHWLARSSPKRILISQLVLWSLCLLIFFWINPFFFPSFVKSKNSGVGWENTNKAPWSTYSCKFYELMIIACLSTLITTVPLKQWMVPC